MESTLSLDSLLAASRHSAPDVPGYRIRALLGRGGMGVVYAAQDERTRELVAIKLLRSDSTSPAALARFDRERCILERLDRLDIARLLDSGHTSSGTPYLVMEYVEGRNIVDYCETRCLPRHERLQLFQKVCRAVAAAHDFGIIHRDLKPANILVNRDGGPKLLDFGIAKLAANTQERLTVTGCRLLTPEYASIEQIRGGRVTPASDVYSLGVILSEIVGRSDARLAAIIDRSMADRPEFRYPSANALSRDVEAYLEGRPLEAQVRRTRRHVFGIALAMCVVALLTFNLRSRHVNTPPSAAERDSMVARHLWNKLSVTHLHKSEAWFRKAVQQDPASSQARAGLADALYFLGELGGADPGTAYLEARVEARRAVELDPSSPVAHAVLGSVLVAGGLAWTDAEREFRTALRLDSRCVRALQGYGCMLMRSGRLEEAAGTIERARLLDPASPILGVLEARIAFYRRNYERARDLLRGVLDRDPTFVLAHYYLALCHQYLGSTEDAQLSLKQAGLSQESMSVEQAWFYARNGDPSAGRRLLAKGSHGTSMVFVAAEMGEADRAFALLSQAVDQKRPIMLAMRSDPRFDPLRTDPRFLALLRRVGLDRGV